MTGSPPRPSTDVKPRSRPTGRHRVTGRLVVAGVVLIALAAAVLPHLFPLANRFDEDSLRIAGVVIFAGSYLALAIGRIPGLAVDRAGIALVGAALMVASGALPIEDAYAAIDLDTLTLLLGMMIVVANLQLSGFFALAGTWIIERTGGPFVLLGAITAMSGVFSAFLVNDAVCLVLAPIVLEATAAAGRKPLPYLLAVAMASNVGSTATITGNPQNMMIGSLSRIAYADFAAALGPIAIAGLAATVAVIALLHRGELRNGPSAHAAAQSVRVNRTLAARAVGATVVLTGLFFAGLPPAKAAIVIGGLLLLTRRVKSRRIYAEIDWSLLLMFAGLFIIVAGAERLLLSPDIIAAGRVHLQQLPTLAIVTAALSNIVSNVPAVLVLKPFVASMADPGGAWLTIAMASTLAGNFTVLGSIANLIVVQKAAAHGVHIGFWDYFRVGAPLTLITLAIGMAWL
jgi:Na+/H+ antiporter NhaD/arsenite permease-like protein